MRSLYLFATIILVSVSAYSQNQFSCASKKNGGCSEVRSGVNSSNNEFDCFSISKVNDAAFEISWSVLNESNNSHFEIQRSVDENNWVPVAIIFTDGALSDSKLYRFTDKFKSQAKV
jgi:hypothetical protein